MFEVKGVKGDTLCFSGSSLGRHLSYSNIKYILENKYRFHEALKWGHRVMGSDREKCRIGPQALRYIYNLDDVLLLIDAQHARIAQVRPQEAKVLATVLNVARHSRTLLSLANIMAHPDDRYAIKHATAPPRRKKDPEELRQRRDEEAAGGIDASFEDSRYEQWIN